MKMLLIMLAFMATAFGPPVYVLATECTPHLDVPNEAAVPMPRLEAVAQEFWAKRGIELPQPVESFIAPALDEGAIGFGELPGTRVWLLAVLLEPGHAYQRCLTYIHERGHNAGLPHGVMPIMEPYLRNSLRVPLCLTYARGGSRIG